VSAAPSDRELLLHLVGLVEALHAKVDELAAREAIVRNTNTAPGLLEALREHFGDEPFSARFLLARADEDPHSPLGDALGRAIDWERSPHARVVKLGLLLARLPGLEDAGSARGTKIYRVVRD
jgi:hypothetical protein